MYIYIASIGTACVFYLNALLCFPIDFKNSYRDIPWVFFYNAIGEGNSSGFSGRDFKRRD